MSSRLETILESQRHCHRIGAILKQLKELGFSKVSECDDNFEILTLVHRGIDDKDYFLSVSIPTGFPADVPKFETQDLPPSDQGFYVWNLHKSNLRSLYAAFIDQISRFSPFRRILKDLDTNTWVLDPPVQGLQHLYRRIVVCPGVSLQITLDPNDAQTLPDLKFLGPEAKVRPLRASLAQNFHNFDPDYTLVQNIERMLDIELPLAQDHQEDQEDFNVDCGICYGYKLGEALPEKSCDQNPKCGRLFHQECLFEWIRSNPDSRQSFQTLFGKCPYCDVQISCKMPS